MFDSQYSENILKKKFRRSNESQLSSFANNYTLNLTNCLENGNEKKDIQNDHR